MPITIYYIGEALMTQLENAGWKVKIEDHGSDDFIHYQAFNKSGPLEAFTRLDLILMELDDDSTNVEIRFVFFADPGIVGSTKRPFGKKVREDNFSVLRTVCVDLLRKADIDAKEEETEIAPRSRYKVKFSGLEYVTAVYEVVLVYWKESTMGEIEISGDYIPKAEGTRLLVELREKLKKEGFETHWLNPLIELDTSMLGGPRRKIRQDLFITDPLIPKIVPYKESVISLSIHFDRIRFLLSLIVPIEETESADAEELYKAFKRKNLNWTKKIKFYFKDIIIRFPAELDVFDITDQIPDHQIEYYITWEFPVGSMDEIVSLMREIKKRYIRWKNEDEI